MHGSLQQDGGGEGGGGSAVGCRGNKRKRVWREKRRANYSFRFVFFFFFSPAESSRKLLLPAVSITVSASETGCLRSIQI